MKTHVDTEGRTTYEEPPFLDPLTCGFVYAAWRVDPVTVGPFVRSSAVRRRKLDEIRAIVQALAQLPEVDGVRVFEASFIPPLRGMPRFDVVMLVRTQSRENAARLAEDGRLRQANPTALFLAANAARFGVTENADAGVNYLLNHFTGSSDPSEAVAVWRKLSGWFVAKTGVDNSTLLRTEESAPYVLINYVRIPGTVVGFLLGQLLRPSFHRYVRALLKRHQLTSRPLFVREVPVGRPR